MRVTNLFLFSTLAFFAQSDPLVQGLEAFHTGDYVQAERSFRVSLKDGKVDDAERARAFLALTLAATNRCTEAEPALVKAGASKSAEIRRLAGLALVQCRIASNHLDDAAAVLSRLKASYPADADVLYQSARLHMTAWNDAIHMLYEKAPASFRVNQLSGEILETQGQFSEAAIEYRKAIAKNPQALNLHFRLARALLMGSHTPEGLEAAMKELDAELALNPSDCVALYQAAQIYLNQQKPQQAEANLQRALDINPTFPEALIALGKLRMDEKKYTDAVSLLQKAVTLMPKSESAHYSLMMAYRNAGRMADARREKAVLDKLQKPPEGEFTEFLKKLGEKSAERK
jgi:tetratricopeptide (TPR) repeat protein